MRVVLFTLHCVHLPVSVAMHPDLKKGLTELEQRFVDLYAGDAKEAARLAGAKRPQTEGIKMLGKAAVKRAITERNGDWKATEILSREDRQRLWSRIALGLETETAVINGEPTEIPARMPNRLKALEALARSEGDFFDNIKVEIGLEEELKKLTMDQAQQRIKQLEDQGVLELIQRGGTYQTPDGDPDGNAS